MTLLTGFGTEAPYVDALLNGFAGRRSDAREFALRYRVVLVRSQAGVPVDVALGAMPFEERAVARASEFVIQPGVALVTCSAEDLIVFKAFAGRERDWLDIEGIALRQRGRLDESLIWADSARSSRSRRNPRPLSDSGPCSTARAGDARLGA